MVCKMFFALNSLFKFSIPEKKKRRREAITKHFALQANTKRNPVVWVYWRTLGVIYYNRKIFREGHRNCREDWCLISSQPIVIFISFFDPMKLFYDQKYINQIILNYATLKGLALPILKVLIIILLIVNISLLYTR